MKGEKIEVTIIVLTCHRSAGLKRIIDSIKVNTQDIAYDLLVMIDQGDIDAYNYCVKRKIKCFLSNGWNDFVWQANAGVYLCRTNFFVVLGDDLEVIHEHWLSKALTIFKQKFPDDIGLLSFNDGINGGHIFACGMSSKKFVQNIGGHLYFPGYRHYAGDREIKFLSQKLGCWHHEDSIKIKHHHYSKNEIEKDETYQKSEKFWGRDRRLRRIREKDLVNLKNYCYFRDYGC